MKLGGRTAVITGAGSGIGRGIALALAKRGCNLALADVNQAGIDETAAMVGNVEVSTHCIDVGDREQCLALPAAVLAAHGRVDLLFNNAGVAIGGTFEQVDEADFDWLMGINFAAVVRLTRAFLPHLKTRDAARIVNTSSLFGLIAPPNNTAYCASKFAVRGFSESLRNELALAGSKVGISVVHPGGVRTSIARNARAPKHVTNAEAVEAEAMRAKFDKKFLKMPPERAGEIIVSGVEQDRPRIIVGNDAKFGALIERLAPVSYWKFLGRSMSA
jgi:NAD(P)-dependent dehydrogenase (short-subunit alcohol dehydrogenase family)